MDAIKAIVWFFLLFLVYFDSCINPFGIKSIFVSFTKPFKPKFEMKHTHIRYLIIYKLFYLDVIYTKKPTYALQNINILYINLSTLYGPED